MKSNRRDLLAVMGLGGVAAVAMNPEAAATSLGDDRCNAPNVAQDSKEAQEEIASQLEGLAKAVRAGTVRICDMETKSRFNPRDPHFMEHKVKLTVEMLKQEGEE
jgi:hypothetical protein